MKNRQVANPVGVKCSLLVFGFPVIASHVVGVPKIFQHTTLMSTAPRRFYLRVKRLAIKIKGAGAITGAFY